MSSQRSSIIVGLVVVVILISSGGLLILFSQTEFDPGNETTTTTTTTTMMEPNDDFVNIEEIVAATFDGIGFAEEEGSDSTISSTLKGVELLSDYDLIDCSLTKEMLNDTYDAIMEREHPNGGFSEVPGALYQSLESTALSLRTLRLMDRLEQTTKNGIISYLWDEFGGGLSCENWITEGVWEVKYWGLRCAYEIGNIGYIGLKPITLDNIFEEGEEPGAGTDPVLWIGEVFFGTQLDTKTLSDRLIIFECFEYMIPNPLHRPVLIGLLVNESDTVNQLVSMFDETSGLVDNDFEFTWTVFRILTNTGNMTHIFDSENGAERINRIQEQIDAVVDIDNARANPNATVSEIFFMTKIAQLIAFNLDHGYIENPTPTFLASSLDLHAHVKKVYF